MGLMKLIRNNCFIRPLSVDKQGIKEDLDNNVDNEFTSLFSKDIIEKSKVAEIGEIRKMDDGRSYQKMKDGWLLTDVLQKSKNKTYFSEDERTDLEKKGEAMPGGRYPIRNRQDLKDAIRLSGMSKLPKSEVRKWIKKRAKELNLESELPESWKQGSEDKIEKAEQSFNLDVSFKNIEDAEIFKAFASDALKKANIDSWNIVEVTNDPFKDVFKTYLNFIEGVKTRIKNLHWSELDNSKHQNLDDLNSLVSEFEDKLAEAAQSHFGRFDRLDIIGEEINIEDPIAIVDLIFDYTTALREDLSSDSKLYNGEISWIDDFLASLKQNKYRLQMH